MPELGRERMAGRPPLYVFRSQKLVEAGTRWV